jgi:hypothetical protein
MHFVLQAPMQKFIMLGVQTLGKVPKVGMKLKIKEFLKKFHSVNYGKSLSWFKQFL